MKKNKFDLKVGTITRDDLKIRKKTIINKVCGPFISKKRKEKYPKRGLDWLNEESI